VGQSFFEVNVAVIVQYCILPAMLPEPFYTRPLQLHITLQTIAREMLVRSFFWGLLMWAVARGQGEGALQALV